MTDIEEANDIRLLNLLEKTLEADIFNYALERTEDLFDEEEDEIVRALFWSVGVEEYCVVVTPLGSIKEAVKTKTLRRDQERRCNAFRPLAPGLQLNTTTNA